MRTGVRRKKIQRLRKTLGAFLRRLVKIPRLRSLQQEDVIVELRKKRLQKRKKKREGSRDSCGYYTSSALKLVTWPRFWLPLTPPRLPCRFVLCVCELRRYRAETGLFAFIESDFFFLFFFLNTFFQLSFQTFMVSFLIWLFRDNRPDFCNSRNVHAFMQNVFLE